MNANRLRQFRQLRIVEIDAGLMKARPKAIDGKMAETAFRGGPGFARGNGGSVIGPGWRLVLRFKGWRFGYAFLNKRVDTPP
ncbi:MAG: hypothetical protein V3U53_02750 [bacterium]